MSFAFGDGDGDGDDLGDKDDGDKTLKQFLSWDWLQMGRVRTQPRHLPQFSHLPACY